MVKRHMCLNARVRIRILILVCMSMRSVPLVEGVAVGRSSCSSLYSTAYRPKATTVSAALDCCLHCLITVISMRPLTRDVSAVSYVNTAVHITCKCFSSRLDDIYN